MVILYGLLIGIFVSLIGGGGASLYLGVLTSQLGLATAVAVPTSLFVAVPALFFGFLTQLKINNVQVSVGNKMIITSIPGIIFGTIISKYIPTIVYNWIVGSLLVVMGLLVLIKFFKSKSEKRNVKHSRISIPFLGLLSGLMVGVGGLSGGATTISGLTLMGLPALLAAGTTTYVLWVMAVIGLLSHLFTSTIDFKAGFPLMIGAIIGSIITPIIMNKFNSESMNKYLTPVLGIIIVYFGISMIYG